MSETKVSMTYTGTGGENPDVGFETGGSWMMEPGKTYEVSEGLAKKLSLTRDWKPATESDEDTLIEATDGAKAKAEELGVELSAVEGTGSGGRITANDVEKYARELEADLAGEDG